MTVENYGNKGTSYIMSVKMGTLTFVYHVLEGVQDPSFRLHWEMVSDLLFELMEE